MSLGSPPMHGARRFSRAVLARARVLATATAACSSDVTPMLEPGPDAAAAGMGGAPDGNSPWAERDVGTLDGAVEEASAGPADAAAGADGPDFACPEAPAAYVFEAADPYTNAVGDARALLAAAGFDVQTLPLVQDPRDLRGLIFLGSFVSETQEHQDGVARFPTQIYYLNWNDKRYDHTDTVNPQDFNPYQYGTAGGVNDGEQLWQKVVRKHALVMTLNGHVLGDGTGYLASVTDKGNICHQMLSNYQFRTLGGEGYMRLLQFEEDGKTVKVYTYSPLYDSFLTEPDQSYTIRLDVPEGPAK